MTVLRYILSRYDRRSALALAALCTLYIGVFIVWNRLIDWSQGMDWLLAVIWVGMTALLCWDVNPARDVPLVIVAFFGGLVIEWWGTTTEIWRYYTAERPPIWILPAWPVATLAIDRIMRVLDRAAPPWSARWPFVLVLALFTVAMTHFAWPSIHIFSTQVVIGLMVGVTLTSQEPRRELLLFAAGTMLGVWLEYWGTSRWCWRYYTKEIPPIEAVFAHGFASVAFLRGWQVAAGMRRRIPWLAPA